MVEGPCHEVGMVWDHWPHGLYTSITLGLLYTRRVLLLNCIRPNLVQLHAVYSNLPRLNKNTYNEL